MSLKTGVEDAHYFSFAELNGHKYMANGWDPMQRWNGVDTATVDAGIATAPQDWAPSPSTAAGNVTVGDHVFRYRYKSKDTGYVSDPSNHVTINVSSGAQQLTFNVAASGNTNIVRSTDTKVDQIVVEMTTVGSGDPFYEAATFTQTDSTVVINLDDDTLVGSPIDWENDGHSAPPAVSIIVGQRGRLIGCGRVLHAEGTVDVTNASTTVNNGSGTNFTASCVGMFFQVDGDSVYYKIASRTSGTVIELETAYAGSTDTGKAYSIYSLAPNTIYETYPLYPESWPPLRFTKALVAKSDRIRGMIDYFGDLLVCGDRTTEKWSYNSSLVNDGQAYAIAGDRGCVNNRCLLEQDGVIYGWDSQGIWQFRGGGQEHISYPVDPLWAVMNWAVKDTFHAVFVPIERTIRFYFARDDDDTTDVLPKDFIEYHVDSQKWGTGRHAMAITSSATVGTGSERMAVVGDENGYWWFIIGTTEGVDPDTTLEGTVSAGATDTIISIDEGGLDTAGDGLAGAPCYSVEHDEEQVIASNTASQVTLATAFAGGAPTTGTKLYFGRINTLLKSKAISLGRLNQKTRPRFLHIYFEPTSASMDLRVRFYLDYGSSAYSWTKTSATYAEGVSITSGETDAVVDLSTTGGYARIPIGHFWKRTIEIEMEYRGPAASYSLIGWELDGVVDDMVKFS